MNRYRQSRPVRAAPPSIARAAASVFSALARQTKYVEPALAERWRDIAGAEIAALARPGRLTGRRREATLEVYCSSGAAAAQLQMLTGELIERLNRYLGPGAVARIAIRQTASAADAREEGPLGLALARFRAAVEHKNDEK